MKNRKKQNKRRFKKSNDVKTTNYILIVVALIILLSIPLLITISRYAIDSINNYFARSREFYFLSDKLTADNYSYVIDNWSGVDPYTVVINMSSMENDYLKTSYDIAYDISYTASSNLTCQISKTSGIIPATTNEDLFTLTMTPNISLFDGDSVSVEITAVSKTNYEKTLQARFTLRVGQEQLTFSIVDKPHSPYAVVNITNSLSFYVVRTAFNSYQVGDRININTYNSLSEVNKTRCSSAEVRLNFSPNRFVLDMTNQNYIDALNVGYQNIGGYNHINSITFAVHALSSTNVILYKSNILEDNTYPAPGTPTPAVQFQVIR